MRINTRSKQRWTFQSKDTLAFLGSWIFWWILETQTVFSDLSIEIISKATNLVNDRHLFGFFRSIYGRLVESKQLGWFYNHRNRFGVVVHCPTTVMLTKRSQAAGISMEDQLDIIVLARMHNHHRGQLEINTVNYHQNSNDLGGAGCFWMMWRSKACSHHKGRQAGVLTGALARTVDGANKLI